MFYLWINLLFFKFSTVAPTSLPSEWLIPTKWKFKASSRVLWQKKWIMAELWIQQSRFFFKCLLTFSLKICFSRKNICFFSKFSMPVIIFPSYRNKYSASLYQAVAFSQWIIFRNFVQTLFEMNLNFSYQQVKNQKY